EADLAHDRAALAQVKIQLVHERRVVAELKQRLAKARLILARQLASRYEGTSPDLVSVGLDANGFTHLLDELDLLKRAEQQQQSTITTTQQAKVLADSAETQLTKLEASEVQITQQEAVHARALAGMNALLESRQGALERARSAQRSALAASREKG